MSLFLFPLAWLFRRTDYRTMVWVGVALSLVSQLMYGFSYLVKDKWFIFASRLIQGFACYQALGKTYTAVTTGDKKRLFYFMIFGTCALAVYFTGNFLAYLTDIVAKNWNNSVLNRYTAPGWLMVCLWLVYAVLFAVFWEEPTDEQLGKTPDASPILGFLVGGEEGDVDEDNPFMVIRIFSWRNSGVWRSIWLGLKRSDTIWKADNEIHLLTISDLGFGIEFWLFGEIFPNRHFPKPDFMGVCPFILRSSF